MTSGPLTAVRDGCAGADDGATVVSLLGVRGSRPGALSNAALGTAIDTSSQRPPLLSGGHAEDAVVLVHSAVGDDARDAAAGDAATLAVCLAGVVVLNARVADFERGPAAAGIASLMNAVRACLELRVATTAPAIPARRLLVVAVREYEADEVEADELETAITGMLNAAYGDLEQLPAAYRATELQDLFDVQFQFLPNERLCSQEFEAAVTAFGRVVEDAGRNGYADAGMTPASLDAAATRVWEALNPASVSSSREMPAERELAATFACNEIMKTVFDRYASTTRQWKSTVEAGRIIRDFGKESSNLIQSTLDKYVEDATSYRTTKAFSRKKDELRSSCLADAYSLYAKQILKLREVAYQVFRGNLARIRINDRVEKNVNTAVKEAEVYFVEKAESLRSTLSNWRFDNERHELVNHMREDATERLQLARLQGNYVPPFRAPVAVAFHTLLTSPFGQDANTVQADPATQMHPKVDKDKAKKAGLSRARPHQRSGFKFSTSGQDVKLKECVDMFSGIYASASETE